MAKMRLGEMSAARREGLKQHIHVNEVLNSVALDKYFSLAKRVKEASEEASARALSNKGMDLKAVKLRHADLDKSYVYLKRFGRLALEVIPSHNYYRSPKFVTDRKWIEGSGKKCLDTLEEVVKLMDADEHFLRLERIRRQELIDAEKARIQKEEKEKALLKRLEVEARAREAKEIETRQKLKQALLAEKYKVSMPQEEDTKEEDTKEEDTKEEDTKKEDTKEEDTRPEPPSYDQVKEDYVPEAVDTSMSIERRQRLEMPEYCAGAKIQYLDRGQWQDAQVLKVHLEDIVPYFTIKIVSGDRPRELQTEATKLRPKPDDDARLLGAKPLAPGGLDGGLLLDNTLFVDPQLPPQYTEITPLPTTKKHRLKFKDLRQSVAKDWSKYHAGVQNLSTYQGRVRDARGLDSTNGCAVIAPLVSYQHIISHGHLTNDEISKLIDTVVPPILSHVRSKHGLGHGAFIIPSDVHDYLYDQGAISRDMFEGVYGGNVLDDEHLNNLVSAIINVPNEMTAACAFFFKEHVTAILREKNGSFSFVDSMPGARGLATRTNCPDANALRTYIKHYALSKLTGHASFIDANVWTEATAEFDPRVFQAYVWKK